MKITFCIVTYKKDFDLAKRLISSIEENWHHHCIEEIIIFVNDNVNFDITSSLNLRILYSDMNNYDWYTQQFIKLNFANYVNTEYFIIHDSKDYYLPGEKIDLSYYFNENKQSIGSWFNLPNYTYFKNQFINAYSFYGIDFNNVSAKLNEHTPIICKTEIMKDLIFSLKDINLVESFKNHLYTEFSLMSAFIESKKLQETYLTLEDDFDRFLKIQSRIKVDRCLQSPIKNVVYEQ